MAEKYNKHLTAEDLIAMAQEPGIIGSIQEMLDASERGERRSYENTQIRHMAERALEGILELKTLPGEVEEQYFAMFCKHIDGIGTLYRHVAQADARYISAVAYNWSDITDPSRRPNAWAISNHLFEEIARVWSSLPNSTRAACLAHIPGIHVRVFSKLGDGEIGAGCRAGAQL